MAKLRTVFLGLILRLYLPVSAAEIAAKVLSVSGEARAEKTALKVGHKLGEGVRISTGPDGRVKLFLYPRGILYVGPDSRIKLGRVEKPSKIISGVFRFIRSSSKKIKKRLGMRGVRLDVITDNAVVGVRGTDYFVKYFPLLGESEVVCFSGAIEFENTQDPRDKKTVPAEHWGGLGGRFGPNIGDLIHLPKNILDTFRNSLTWQSDLKSALPAEDLAGESIPSDAP